MGQRARTDVEAHAQIVKECCCGAAFTAAEWQGLRYVGILESKEDFAEQYDLRDCKHCGSTISLEIPKGTGGESVR